MQRVIIFEGPDKVGKTEIATELSRRISVPYFKNRDEVRNFLDPKDYFVNTLRYADPYFISFLEQTRHSAIIDRHYPSEWVYSKVFKRKTDMDALRRTDEAMARLGAKIVICWRSDYGGKSDDMFPEKIDGKRLKQLHDAYVQFREWTKCDSIWLNVDDEDLQREVTDVLLGLEMAVPFELGSAGICYDGLDDPYDDSEEFEEDESEIEHVGDAARPRYPDPDVDWTDTVEEVKR